MIQGGDPDSKGAPAGKMLGVGGPDYTLEAEIKDGLFHKRGALAAARLGQSVAVAVHSFILSGVMCITKASFGSSPSN